MTAFSRDRADLGPAPHETRRPRRGRLLPSVAAS